MCKHLKTQTIVQRGEFMRSKMKLTKLICSTCHRTLDSTYRLEGIGAKKS